LTPSHRATRREDACAKQALVAVCSRSPQCSRSVPAAAAAIATVPPARAPAMSERQAPVRLAVAA
jgi:hypothetical protein